MYKATLNNNVSNTIRLLIMEKKMHLKREFL